MNIKEKIDQVHKRIRENGKLNIPDLWEAVQIIANELDEIRAMISTPKKGKAD